MPLLTQLLKKDIGEAGRDHTTDTEVEQRPGRVLTAGATAEVLIGDQNLGIAISVLVQDELRDFSLPSGVKRISSNRCLPRPGALDGLQILFGDDHVGVDVDHGQGARRYR